MGLVGTNVYQSREEQEEDLLECLYRGWRQEEEITIADYAMQEQLPRKEVSVLVRNLIARGYLQEMERKKDPLQLTEQGRLQGMECLVRHEKLTQFFQMVSGMDQKEAQEDACRVEHVISQKALEGIDKFLKYGDVYDRTYSGMDLCTHYGEGSFQMLMGIYELERRNPRFLAAEDAEFEQTARLGVRAGISCFVLRRKKPDAAVTMWHRRHNEWIKVEADQEEYTLPSDIFTYSVSGQMPTTEANAIIAFTRFEQKPVTIDCRELNIHIW